MASKYFQCRNAIYLLQIALTAALFHTATPCVNMTEDIDLFDPNANGTNVVQRVVSKLHSLQLVTCNSYRLLRRIALVETEDGTRMQPNHGGIWALDKSKFINIKKDVEELVRTKLCLAGNENTPYAFLDQPLISGLAASVYLTYLENNRNIRIPLAGYYIEEQAQFWKDYYHSGNLTEDDFVNQVESFERKYVA